MEKKTSFLGEHFDAANKGALYFDYDDYSNSNSSYRKVIIEWSYENEELIAEWCDIAQCYKWLNAETYKHYKTIDNYMTLPCIVISTVNGSMVFGIPNIPQQYQSTVPIIFGCISIFVAVLTILQQYYRFSELKENHRIMSVEWDKLARNINIELSKPPAERVDAKHFIKFSRVMFERLIENTYMIPESIVERFKNMLDGDDYRERIQLKRPDICGVITSINEKRRIWFPKNTEYKDKKKYYNYNNNRSISKNASMNYDKGVLSPRGTHFKSIHRNGSTISLTPLMRKTSMKEAGSTNLSTRDASHNMMDDEDDSGHYFVPSNICEADLTARYNSRDKDNMFQSLSLPLEINEGGEISRDSFNEV